MQEKGRGSISRLARTMTALVLGFTLLQAMGVATVAAAPMQTPSLTTRSGQETLQLSASDCAALKAAAGPMYANDSHLCEFIHGWTETITTASPAEISKGRGAAAGPIPYGSSCWWGDHSFHDYATDNQSGIFWEIDLDTTFHWRNYNTCGGTPTVDSPSCYWMYARNTDIYIQGCYTYEYQGSTWTSRAAVETAHITEHWPYGTNDFFKSQRRECYSYNAPDSCNWTVWTGV